MYDIGGNWYIKWWEPTRGNISKLILIRGYKQRLGVNLYGFQSTPTHCSVVETSNKYISRATLNETFRGKYVEVCTIGS